MFSITLVMVEKLFFVRVYLRDSVWWME